MKKARTVIAVIALLVIAAVAWKFSGGGGGGTGTGNGNEPGAYDAMAKCLTEKGVKMYGAYWCPHCQNQEKMFGESWKYVTYTECSLPNRAGETEACSKAGIEGYPTWEFASGERVSGEMTLQQLSEKSGCALQ